MGRDVKTSFRQLLFWLHLLLGLTAGAVIAITAFTGAVMALEKPVTAWAERTVSEVKVPSGSAARESVADMLADVRELWPEARPGEVTLVRQPAAPVIITLGRTNTAYVNPYTGEIKTAAAPQVHAFFQLVLRWHRWLGATPVGAGSGPEAGGVGRGGAGRENSGGWRQTASTIVGISAAIFLILCVSGLILWWPKNLAALRSILWFRRDIRGRARDWNWHHVFGFWSAPILILTTFTGVVMSFHAVGDLIYKRPPGEAADITLPSPGAGSRPLDADALFGVARTNFPAWQKMTLKMNARRPRGGGEARANGAVPAAEVNATNRPVVNRGAQPVQLAVEDAASWSPIPAQLTLNPYTGEVLKKEVLEDFDFRRAFRAMNRSLHTGEAGGWAGEICSFLACFGALMLIWTGFALAWRRFRPKFPRRRQG